MSQSKLNDLAGKFGKNGPPGLGIGLKLLAVGGALAYGIANSIYTGNFKINVVHFVINNISIDIVHNLKTTNFFFLLPM